MKKKKPTAQRNACVIFGVRNGETIIEYDLPSNATGGELDRAGDYGVAVVDIVGLLANPSGPAPG